MLRALRDHDMTAAHVIRTVMMGNVLFVSTS